MINLRIIYKILGQLLFLEALWMLISLGISIYYREDDSFSFIVAFLVTVAAGLLLKGWGRDAENSLSRRDAYLLVSLTWVVFSFFGTLPFYIGGYLPSFTDAYFETMSGFTTTGASVIDNVESMPHGILFWRSLTQWIGGLGIVFFTIALLPSLVGGSVRVFSAEATGPIRTKLHPRLSTTAKWIWSIYLLLTLSCVGAYFLGGMSLFDSVNYAMSTTATGGFSTHNESMAYFNSPRLEYICTLFTFLAGINFSLLYAAIFKLRVKDLFRNSEFKLYIVLMLAFTLFMMIQLINVNQYSIEQSFRHGIFHVVTMLTTTSFFSDDLSLWPHVSWVIFVICMFVGACSGSTSGGFKSVRCVMLLRIMKNEFRQILHPKAMFPVKVNGVNVPMQGRVTLLAFLTIYLILCLVITFAMIAMGIDDVNAVNITFGCLSNVGPTLSSMFGPEMSWSDLPDLAKWFCSLMMLVGRLEIFTVLVIFTPAFWKGN